MKIEKSLTPTSVDYTIETQKDKVYYITYVLNLFHYSKFTVLCPPREHKSATCPNDGHGAPLEFLPSSIN